MSLQDTEKLKVKVTLQTTIQNGKEKESYELVTSGTVLIKKNDIYLQYTEETEAGKTNTTIKYKNAEALLMRGGAVKMRQLFRPGGITRGHYESLYGTLPMVTKTKSIHHVFFDEQNEGEFTFHYELIMQEESLGHYIMVIKYKEEE
ncbi:DUF1934 domain-containing protein [Peribacillus sp. SCS-155]|uniref:DUF1934 domain-containing protein n=1 Tax=Peribacillus sedimenti TaxID=3115297 RepID=UPI0039069C22